MSFWSACGKSIKKSHYWWFYPALVGGTAYADIVIIDAYKPYEYLILNAVEIFLIFVGINIGFWIGTFYSTNSKESDESGEE